MTEPAIVWRHASRGVYFIGLGAFLLLCTQGAVPWSLWRRALAYWPLLLVGMGLRIIFERTRAPALVLLSPLLVLGTLTYLALHPASPERLEWTKVRTARTEKAKRWTLTGSLGMVDLNLRARPLSKTLLVEGRVTEDERQGVHLAGSGEEPEVRLGARDTERSFLDFASPGRDQRWDLTLSQELPLEVDLHLAFAGGTVDLTPAPVAGVEVEGAFNDLTMRLGAPKTDTPLVFHGAFNQVKVIVPGATPVRIRSDGFLNSVAGRSRPAKETGPAYRVVLEGAFNRLDVGTP